VTPLPAETPSSPDTAPAPAKPRDDDASAPPERDASAAAGCALLVKQEEQAMLAEYGSGATSARR
jgi:hypothetical protein